MVMAFKNGLMAPSMRVIGKITRRMVKVYFTM
jgi:hypothetical protein